MLGGLYLNDLLGTILSNRLNELRHLLSTANSLNLLDECNRLFKMAHPERD